MITFRLFGILDFSHSVAHTHDSNKIDTVFVVKMKPSQSTLGLSVSVFLGLPVMAAPQISSRQTLGSPVAGEATFYGGNLNGGTCSFSNYQLPAGMYGTAFSGSAWNNAAECGACLDVTGPNGNTLRVMVSEMITTYVQRIGCSLYRSWMNAQNAMLVTWICFKMLSFSLEPSRRA